MQYKFAENDGSLIIEEYDESTRLTQDEVRAVLVEAFHTNAQQASIVDVSDEVYKVDCGEGDYAQTVFVSAKPTTPGGRGTALQDEQRILQLPCYLNAVADQKDAGNKAMTLGVYRRNNGIIICAWRVAHSNAAEGNRVSKQIKIDTIANAMRYGFAQQSRGQGEFVCAFRKEFMYFYLNNAEWLHGASVTELPQYSDPINNDGLQSIRYNTGYISDFPRNRILFGAPGTGKSYTLNKERRELLGDNNETDYERVTFHPDYSYANFVGTYKPISGEEGDIAYRYVPGPFMRVFVNAIKNGRTDRVRPFLLIIEEINRANVAAVFGDIFQLLDRGNTDESEYPIQASEDIRKYLVQELGGDADDYAKIRIPDNMFVWATMNSADQGVFPVDTAFKRRWDFTYLGIDDSETGIVGLKVVVGKGEYRRIVEWNSLRKAINSELLTYKVNEDKLMGPYFIGKKNLIHDEHGVLNTGEFIRIFKNKVLMYLFDDAAKQKRPNLFGGNDEKVKSQYSKLCEAFDTKGVFIFCDSISKQFIDVPNSPEESVGDE